MNPLTKEWVEKAEGDFATAIRESRARKAPNYDAVCFHAQQCAEKYLKAILQESGKTFGRTHNLVALAHDAIPVFPEWKMFIPTLAELAEYAVAFRYPGESASQSHAKNALAVCKQVRTLARKCLRLK